MLGDVIGFVAAAHLYSEKIKQPVEVYFQEARKDILKYFDGVVWVPKEPGMVDCGGDPTLDQWFQETPKMNGVSRFYRFMDPSMTPTKSFDVHFNRKREGTEEKIIGLVTHSNTQGDIDDQTLETMLSDARKAYPEHKICLIGNKDNKKIPEGVEDWRQEKGDIDWIISTIEKCSLLITPQSGPCFIAAGWRVPMWVYRSKERFWDQVLNYQEYKVERWYKRSVNKNILSGLYRKNGLVSKFEKFDTLFLGTAKTDDVYIIGTSASINEMPGVFEFLKDKTCCLLNAANLDKRLNGEYHFIHHTQDYEKYLNYNKGDKKADRFNEVLISNRFKFVPGYNNLIDAGIALGDNVFTFSNHGKEGIKLHHCHNISRNCGTIAADAMEIMSHIGFKKVYLIGFDLRKNGHGYYDKTQKDKFTTKPENNIYVESICKKYPQTEYITLSPWGPIQNVVSMKWENFSEKNTRGW
jgi:hypothetical protein